MANAARARRIERKCLEETGGYLVPEIAEIESLVGNRPLTTNDFDTGNREVRYISSEELVTATRKLSAKLPDKISGVAGIPRSGMAPAAFIAMWQHVPLFELSAQHGLQPIGHGNRGYFPRVQASAPLIVVDDSVYSGGAIRRAKQQISGNNILWGSVFVRPEERSEVDFWGELLSSPHIFDWNLWNNLAHMGAASDPMIRGGIATDFDGVLCYDPVVPDSDTEEGERRYLHWLENAKPIAFPRKAPIPLIVTARLEKHRPQTEAWLRRYGFQFQKLVMHPAKTFAERNRNYSPGEHKGRTFRNSPCSVFLESDERQCEAIFRTASKPVVCTKNSRVWQ